MNDIKNATLARLAALPNMDAKELKQLWSELFNEPGPNKRSNYLVPRLAWRIQELAYGGLSPQAQRQIDTHVRSNKEVSAKPNRIKRPVIGTRFVRVHRGIEHQVTVTRSGFEYQGKTYGSLSHVARDITGTRWSGPAFFGLNGDDE